jgi:hypothetical protein
MIAKSSAIIFEIALQCNYYNAISKKKSRAWKRGRKIDMAADISVNL